VGRESVLPRRPEIEEKWVALIDGRLTREEVSAWARPLCDQATVDIDVMIQSGLSALAGFTMISAPFHVGMVIDPPPVGEYLRPMSTVTEWLERWRSRCIEVDADPDRWRQVEYRIRRPLPDGTELPEGRMRTSSRYGLGDLVNNPVWPDGRSKEGRGCVWRVTAVENDGELLVLEVAEPFSVSRHQVMPPDQAS